MTEEEYIKEHNLDEIDAFLFKEFGIMGGACSAQRASEYYTARMIAEKLWKKEEPVGSDFDTEWENYFKYKGNLATVNIKDLASHFANWQKQKMLNKAYEWLYQQQLMLSDVDKFIEDFRKAMEEEK